MYYSNRAATSLPTFPSNIWTSAGYYGVYHSPMDAVNLFALKDYASAANNASFETSAFEQYPGKIGSSFSCSSGNAYDLPNFDLYEGIQTFSGWVFSSTTTCSVGGSANAAFILSLQDMATTYTKVAVVIGNACDYVGFFNHYSGLIYSAPFTFGMLFFRFFFVFLKCEEFFLKNKYFPPSSFPFFQLPTLGIIFSQLGRWSTRMLAPILFFFLKTFFFKKLSPFSLFIFFAQWIAG